MSIVEKAIAKLQTSGPAAREVRTPVEAPRSAPTADQVAPEPAPVTSTSVPVNLDGLQSAGMLAPSHGALIVRNQFRRLKWSLLDEVEKARSNGHPNPGAFLITSALPGEGKTFVSLNLALSLAREENYQVVLVDGDVAKGHVSTLLDLREQPGLTEWLADPNLGLQNVLVKTNIDRLYVLPAGRFTPNAAELMAGGRMATLLKELVGSGKRIVLFDCAPVLATNTAHVLARALPRVLLVVRAEHTPQSAVLAAVDLLDRNKVIAVLNQAHVDAGNENYNQPYGYYGNEHS